MAFGKRRSGSSGGCCSCSAIPWVPTLALLLTVAATIVWGVYYARARNAISQLTTELPLDGSTEQQVADFLRGVYIASLVILIVLIALAVGLMLLRGMQRARQNPNCAGCGPMGRGGLGALKVLLVVLPLLLWFTTLLVVILFGLHTALAGVMVAGDVVAGQIDRASGQVYDVARDVLNNVTNGITQAQNSLSTLSTDVPAPLQGLPFLSQLTPALQSVSQVVGQAVGALPGQGTCEPDCIDLTPFAVRLNLDQGCVCLLATVRAAQQSAHVAWQDLVACAIALLVAYIAASWLLMDSTAGFVHAKRDRRQLQQAADGQLLMPNGGAAPYGYSAGGPAAHKHGWHNGQQMDVENVHDVQPRV